MRTSIAGLISSLALLLISCSDYNLHLKPESVEPGVIAPEIDVTPIEHEFGNLNATGDIGTITLTIENLGNDTLTLHGATLVNGVPEFTLSVLSQTELEPTESTDLIVTYDPSTYEANYEEVSILSNDEDESEVIVPLNGAGDAPVIQVTPPFYDFGPIFVGCDDGLEILIENIGNVDLNIDDLQYYASLPVDFAIEDYEMTEGPLPWVLPPGGWVSIAVDYTPLDIIYDGGWLEVMSDDPITPIAVAEQEAIGDYETWITDNFSQDEEVAVDILFVVDNSGSMSANQTNLKNNFGDFMSVFVSAGVDYHVALITTDQSEFVGSVITSATTDPITEFEDQVDLIGYSGWAIEKGLWFAYESTITGDASSGSSTGFLRSDARLVVVYVSDEPDGSTSLSYGGGSTTMTPSDYSSSLLSLKSSSDLVVAHAVAGDSPSGCTTNGGAQFGDGYYDVVGDLGGTFMSICAADWSVTMDTLARDSIALLAFPLSDTPIEDTITITLDGVATSDWTYDSTANSITFTVAPAEGSAIEITYAIWAECADEETDTGS
ncbi:MAG TPA: choice-of-anchor D domain-containing protein [Dehalococcoidia bacterium]|jgi:hypothetical protein|nr:choice-of-anchor D domain-containing protein [Dehalococcoidia bacterium]